MEGKRGRSKKDTTEKMSDESIEQEKIRLQNRLNQLEEKERQEQEEIDMINQKAQEEARERENYEQWKRHKESVKRLVEERYPPKPALIDLDLEDIELNEDLEEKVKDVRVPETKESTRFWGKIFKKSKVKEGKVAVMLLHPQGDATTTYLDIEKDGSFKIDEEQYNVNEHCLYSLKVKKDRVPICILPTWTMIPIGTKAWFELTQERRGKVLQDIILTNIKKEERVKMDDGKKKNKMNAKTIWIILAVIVGGYIFLKSRGS